MTTPTKELLDTLNHWRIHAGKKPLAAWKESRAKLEAAVAAIPDYTHGPAQIREALEDADRGAANVREATRLDYEAANDEAIPAPEPKAKKPKAEKKSAPDTTGTRTIPELCRALGKREKVGRAKCRRWGSKLRPLMVDPTKWRFKIENLAAVCTILDWEAPADWK